MLGVYLAGEIHTNWREEIADGAQNLNVMFTAPVTDHEASDCLLYTSPSPRDQ